VYNKKKQILQGLNLSYRGDWYLLRAKFTNDSNFFVREVGRGRDVLEWSLEITEVLRGVEGGDGDRKPACTFFWKKDRESLRYLVCLLMSLSLSVLLAVSLLSHAVMKLEPAVSVNCCTSAGGREA